MIDTSATVEIRSSPWKMLGVVAAGVLMTALCALLAFNLLPGGLTGILVQSIGGVGIVFFGLCTSVGLWRLFRERGSVVTISPEGIRDIRVAREFIPWRAVKGISTWKHQGQKVMVLAVDPAVEGALTLTAIAKWTRGANSAIGANGLCITALGLQADYDTLFATALAYARAAERRDVQIGRV